MAQQGQYVGETVFGKIAENVGLGQVVYASSLPFTPMPADMVGKSVWRVADANIINDRRFEGDTLQPGYQQLGIALEAATASAITATQSGTEITILLKGYYSPGLMAYTPGPTNSGGFCNGSIDPGTPMYVMPKFHDYGRNSAGCISGTPPYRVELEPGVYLTQSIVRIIGYGYDCNFAPYVVRFDPDNTWMIV
jgi:hypothetical protein